MSIHGKRQARVITARCHSRHGTTMFTTNDTDIMYGRGMIRKCPYCSFQYCIIVESEAGT